MDVIQSLLPSLETVGVLGYWIVLLIALLESLVVIGAIIPGSTVVVLAGVVSARGYLDIGDLIWFAAIGAIIGDGISYYLGAKGTRMFRVGNKLLKPRHLEMGQRFFDRHGSKSIFVARFVGPLRAIVPFIAGLSGMKPKAFLFWNVTSAFLWAVSHLLLGYFFGSALSVIEVWSTRAGFVIGIIALFVVALYGIRFVVVTRGRDIAAFVLSVSRSVWTGVSTNPDVQRLIKNHPRLFSFAGRRLDRTSFKGLPLTLIAIGFAYILSLFLGIIEDVLSADMIVVVDVRIANLLVYFRTPELTNAFLWITTLAAWPVVASIGIAVSISLWVWRKRTYIPYLWLALATDQTLAYLGKLAVHRARPPNPVYLETSFSFPSGHATAAVALYGFIAYVLIRESQSWPQKVNAFFAFVAVALVIGFSRLYLAVHYLSDVWAGYLLGAIILTTVIAVHEWRRAEGKTREGGAGLSASVARWATSGLGLASLTIWLVLAAQFPPTLDVPAPPTTEMVDGDIGAYFTERPNLQFSESLLGNPAEPLGFIFLATGDDALQNSFAQAAWSAADPVSVVSVARVVGTALRGSQYPTAPMTPSFWNAQVSDFGFQKPTAANTIIERHHVRIWRTNLRRGDLRVYVGTASLDVGFKLYVTHRISPDIDTERTFVKDSLDSAEVVSSVREIQFVAPVLGTNFAKDAFFTNGKLYVVVLK